VTRVVGGADGDLGDSDGLGGADLVGGSDLDLFGSDAGLCDSDAGLSGAGIGTGRVDGLPGLNDEGGLGDAGLDKGDH
jgi:hypothetical protein